MTKKPSGANQQSVVVNQLIAEFMSRSDAGEGLDAAQFIAAHPEHSDELKQHFANVDLLEGLKETGPAGIAETILAAGDAGEVSTEDATAHSVVRGDADSETSVTRDTQQQNTGSATNIEIPETFGRYAIQKVLGQGAMGAVYLAKDTQLDRDVALKIPKFGDSNGVDDEELLERFYREARASATIRSLNICPVHDVGEIDGQHYITMAYIEGRPLKDFTKSKKLHPEKQIITTIRKLALGLAEAHKIGVIHRDLKPANIMVDLKGEPVVMDFGLARRSSSDDVQVTQSGAILGTPAYMAPEQVAGEQAAINHRVDIYALGIIMYELITGEMPFKGNLMAILQQIALNNPKKPSELRKEIDPRLETICLKMMAGDQTQRYQSMNEVAADLQDVLRNPGKRQKKEQAKKTGPKPTSIPSAHEESNPALISIEQPKSYADQLRQKKGKSKQAKPKSNQATSKSSSLLPRNMLITASLGGLLLLFGIVFLVRVSRYDVDITLEDPSFALSVDGDDAVEIKDGKETYRLSAGKHKLRLEKGGLKTELEEFTVDKDGKTAITVRLVGKKAIIFESGEELPVIKPESSLQMVNDGLEPNRSTAQFVLENGGVVAVRTNEGRTLRILNPEKLPEVPFVLIYISMYPSGDLNLRDEQVRGLTELTWFAVRSIEITDAGVAHLARNPNLSYVMLDQTQVTEEGIALLEGLPLDNLRLSNCRNIAASALKSIGRMENLTNLAINGASPITDADIAPLQALTKLRDLELRMAQITAPGIQFLHQALPSCKIISDFGTFGPSDDLDFALSFDGINDYVEIPTLTYDDDSPITIEATFDSTSLGKRLGQVIRGYGKELGPSLFVYEPSEIAFHMHSLVGTKRTSTWRIQEPDIASQTVQVAAIWNGSEAKLFVNGIPTGQLEVRTEASAWELGGFLLGASMNSINTPKNAFYAGTIDEIRISNGVLYTEKYNPPKRFTNQSSTLALYHFDEGTGDVLKDSSGNGHDGKIYGAKWVKGGEKYQGADKTTASTDGGLHIEEGITHFPVASDVKLDPSKPCTIETWVTPTFERAVFHGVLTIGGSENTNIGIWNHQDWAVGINGNKQYLRGSSHGTYIPNELVHIASVRDGSTLRLFINGTESEHPLKKFVSGKTWRDVEAFEEANNLAHRELHLGTGYQKFTGVYHAIRISEFARYNSNFTPPSEFIADKGTIALYQFDENSGDIFHDTSGSGWDGTIGDAKWVTSSKGNQ